MKLSRFFEGWAMYPKYACLSKDIHGLVASPELDIQLFHIGMLARDFSREEGCWPKRIVLLGDAYESKALVKRFAMRNVELLISPILDLPSASKKAISFELGLEFSSEVSETERGKFLVIRFKGQYPRGSQGDAHGYFIYRMICLMAELQVPDAILIDLSALDYTWGDGLEVFPPEFVYGNSRIGILIHAEQVEPYSYVAAKDRMFFSAEDAFARI